MIYLTPRPTRFPWAMHSAHRFDQLKCRRWCFEDNRTFHLLMHITDFESSKNRQLFQRPRLAPVIETLIGQGYRYSHGHRSVLSTELELGGQCFRLTAAAAINASSKSSRFLARHSHGCAEPIIATKVRNHDADMLINLQPNLHAYAQPITQISTPLLHYYNTLNIWGVQHFQPTMCRLSCSSTSYRL